jgi:hypothetical protein
VKTRLFDKLLEFTVRIYNKMFVKLCKVLKFKVPLKCFNEEGLNLIFSNKNPMFKQNSVKII